MLYYAYYATIHSSIYPSIDGIGYISRQRILRCVQKTCPSIGCQRADFLKLVDFIELNAPTAPDIHAPATAVVSGHHHHHHHSNLVHYFQDRDLLIGPMIHYQKLFLLIGR